MRKLLTILSLAMLTNMAQAQEEVSVLFIGNSFTFMNNMPYMFQDIAISKGKKVHVDTVVEGGKNFEYHSKSPETYELIKSRKWDYVVIQGQSNELAQPESKVDKGTLPFAKQIVDSIRENSSCTQVVLYMTWGYKNGNSKWAPIATYDSMQYRISHQYLRFADLLNARVSPVGEVWRNVRNLYTGINLYDPDNQHPSLNGSYLSACTFYASIFGESPYLNESTNAIESSVRQIIELTASQIVLNRLNEWRFIPKGKPLEPGFDVYQNERTVELRNSAKNADWMEWNFGDGHLSTEQDPTHEYQKKGTYTITQKLNNHCKTITLERIIEVK